MSIDAGTVIRIAGLAHFEMGAEERAGLERDLGAILEYVGQLNRVDTAGVEPMSHVLGGQSAEAASAATLRADVPEPSLPAAEALRNAPAQQAGLFQVPQILNRG